MKFKSQDISKMTHKQKKERYVPRIVIEIKPYDYKKISEMTPEEYSNLISDLIINYAKHSKRTIETECFYFDGIKYDKNTPDELWEKLLNAE